MKPIFTLAILFACLAQVQAQEKSMLDDIKDSSPQSQKISGAFKSIRVINAHSTEMLGKGNLDIRILHRFGLINQGAKELFGLDHASMRLGAAYGISNHLMAGIGRSTFRKELDAFVKIRWLQQSKGYKAMPVSLLTAIGTTVWTEKSFDSIKPGYKERSSYYLQLIIGKKITPAFSLQLSPILLYSSNAVNVGSHNTIVALGGGGRLKFSKRMAITWDYHHYLGPKVAGYRSSLSIGVDIETGGHVFQLHFSNAVGMNERAYLAQTTDEFFKADIRFGFNLSRIFLLAKSKPKH